MNAEFLLRKITLGALGAFAFAACGVSSPSIGMLGGNPSDGQGDGAQGDGDDPPSQGDGGGEWSLHDGSDVPFGDGCGDCYSDGSSYSHGDGSGDGDVVGDGFGGDGFGGDGWGDGSESSLVDASVEPSWPPDAGETD